MKTKRLLSVIAVILALLITLNTTSAAMGTAADYLNEVTATENFNESENDIFSPPEKSPVSENEDITVSDNALRFPDVQNSQSFEPNTASRFKLIKILRFIKPAIEALGLSFPKFQIHLKINGERKRNTIALLC